MQIRQEPGQLMHPTGTLTIQASLPCKQPLNPQMTLDSVKQSLFNKSNLWFLRSWLGCVQLKDLKKEENGCQFLARADVRISLQKCFNLRLFQLNECQVNKAILIFKETICLHKNTLPPSANCTVDLSTCTVPNQIQQSPTEGLKTAGKKGGKRLFFPRR